MMFIACVWFAGIALLLAIDLRATRNERDVAIRAHLSSELDADRLARVAVSSEGRADDCFDVLVDTDRKLRTTVSMVREAARFVNEAEKAERAQNARTPKGTH